MIENINELLDPIILIGIFVSMWKVRSWFNDLNNTVKDINHKIDSHEQVCKVRHKRIDEKFERIDERFEKMGKHVDKLYSKHEGDSA